MSRYDGQEWTALELVLPTRKAFFCTAVASADGEGDRYLYVLGGWSGGYVPEEEVHRIRVDADDGSLADGADWEEFPPMRKARSGHACLEVQVK